MNFSVLLFFLHTTIATAIVGAIFLKKRGNVARYFGIGLLIESVAFASWALALIIPNRLPTFITVGAILTLISFIAFLRAATDDINDSLKNLFMISGSVFVLITFIAGRYIFPTPKFISPEGFLMFNLAPFVQLLYITILVMVTIPLVEKVSKLFRSGYSTFLKFVLGIQVSGAIVLITSSDTFSLMVAGWVIGLTYFALWTALLFRKELWKI